MSSSSDIGRRTFLVTLGLAAGSLACGSAAAMPAPRARRLRRVGLQLYSLRDDAKVDLERTLANIAAAGYNDVEMLGSFRNFGMPPAQLRTVLDRNGLRAPSTHVGGNALDDLDRQLDEAATLGHEQIIVASLGISGTPTVDDYRRWADRINDAGRRARSRNIWVGFHNHATDFIPVNGYDTLAERIDPSVARLQLDIGNLAMAGRDPFEYLKRFGPKYWSFHVKDVAEMRATHDVELGKGIIDFRRLLASIDNIDQKHMFVEQESYPGTPLDSVRRDYAYLSRLEF